MKYTRYNITKRSNKKLMKVGLIIITLAIIILGISMISQSNNEKRKSNASEVNFKKHNSNSKKIYVLQCGVFLSKENAETLVNTLKPYGNAFISKKQEKYNVILGIYNDKDLKKVVKRLNEKNIQNHKVTYEIVEDDLCNAEIAELISANLEVLNKFLDKDVKAVKTDKLKKWNKDLKPVDEKSKNIATLKNLKNYVNKLPDEIKGENVSNGYNLIYNCINSIK